MYPFKNERRGGLTQRNENKIDANYGVLDLSVRVPSTVMHHM